MSFDSVKIFRDKIILFCFIWDLDKAAFSPPSVYRYGKNVYVCGDIQSLNNENDRIERVYTLIVF